jgi:hypothetical protein
MPSHHNTIDSGLYLFETRTRNSHNASLLQEQLAVEEVCRLASLLGSLPRSTHMTPEETLVSQPRAFLLLAEVYNSATTVETRLAPLMSSEIPTSMAPLGRWIWGMA